MKGELHIELAFPDGPPKINPPIAMYTIRKLLKKQLLKGSEVELLMASVEQVLGVAFHHMNMRVKGLTPSFAVAVLGRTLLVVDSVCSACQAVGTQAHRELVEIPLAEHLLSALAIYSAGSLPPAKGLVPLKQSIICNSLVREFNGSRWEAWRIEDKEWRESA